MIVEHSPRNLALAHGREIVFLRAAFELTRERAGFIDADEGNGDIVLRRERALTSGAGFERGEHRRLGHVVERNASQGGDGVGGGIGGGRKNWPSREIFHQIR